MSERVNGNLPKFLWACKLLSRDIYSWLAQVPDLAEPLYDLMVKQVLGSNVIHTDDTKVKLIDRSIKGTELSRFWAYLGESVKSPRLG